MMVDADLARPHGVDAPHLGSDNYMALKESYGLQHTVDVQRGGQHV